MTVSTSPSGVDPLSQVSEAAGLAPLATQYSTTVSPSWISVAPTVTSTPTGGTVGKTGKRAMCVRQEGENGSEMNACVGVIPYKDSAK